MLRRCITTRASPAGDSPAGGVVFKRGMIGEGAQMNGFLSGVGRPAGASAGLDSTPLSGQAPIVEPDGPLQRVAPAGAALPTRDHDAQAHQYHPTAKYILA